MLFRGNLFLGALYRGRLYGLQGVVDWVKRVYKLLYITMKKETKFER